MNFEMQNVSAPLIPGIGEIYRDVLPAGRQLG